MKKTYQIFGLLVVMIISFGFAETEIQNPQNQQIVGTWVDSEDLNVKMVFTSDGVAKDYVDNQLTDTYNWQIQEGQTTSGLTISHLILTNVQDPNEVMRFEINALSEQNLALVFQRPGGGLGQLSTYLKQ